MKTERLRIERYGSYVLMASTQWDRILAWLKAHDVEVTVRDIPGARKAGKK